MTGSPLNVFRPPPIEARIIPRLLHVEMIGRDSKTLKTLKPSVKTLVGFYLLISGSLLMLFTRGTTQRFRNAPRSPVVSTGQTHPLRIGRISRRTVYVTNEEFEEAETMQMWSNLSLIPFLVGVLLIYTEEQAKKETQARSTNF